MAGDKEARDKEISRKLAETNRRSSNGSGKLTPW